MRLLVLLLSTIALVRSIEVKLAGTVNFEGQYIQGTITNRGRDVQTLTDDNQAAFDIRDEALKSAIETYHGRKPDNIYLTGESPWGDLYKKYGWSPVEVQVACTTPAELTHVSTENVVLTKSIYENLLSTTKKIKIFESQITHDTVTSYWYNKGKNISANDVEITFDFRIDNADDIARVYQVFAFGSKRRFTAKKTRFQAASVDIVPGQRVLVQLEAKKGTLRFKIPYKVSVAGRVAAHYNEKYQNHYFYGLPINQVIEATYNRPEIVVEQWLQYEFYYGVKLNIIDAADGHTVLQSLAADSTSSGRRKASVATDAAKNGKKRDISTGNPSLRP